MHRKDILTSAICFSLSTIITWWFIVAGKPLYHDTGKMLLSCSIAGAKWAIQIAMALLFLQEKRWEFIRRISIVCLIGSLILLPFCIPQIQAVLGLKAFLFSLVGCVLLMIVLYYRNVRKTGISIKWFWGWICCLAIAISLQLTVVFHVLQL